MRHFVLLPADSALCRNDWANKMFTTIDQFAQQPFTQAELTALKSPLDAFVVAQSDDPAWRHYVLQLVRKRVCPRILDLISDRGQTAIFAELFGAKGQASMIAALETWILPKPVAAAAAAPAKARAASAPLAPKAVAGKAIAFQTGMKHKDLQSWAGTLPLRRLTLAMKLDDLHAGHLLPYGSYMGSHVTIQDVLTRYTVGDRYYGVPQQMLDLVIRVCQMADEPSAQLAHEQNARLNHAQLPDPELELLRQRLLALRATQAPHGQSRPSVLSRVDLREFNSATRVLTFVDPDVQRFCPQHLDNWLFVQIDEAGQRMVETNRACKGRCPCAVAAVDHLLDLLSEAKISKDLKEIAHVLAVPSWQLMLDRMDVVLQQHEKKANSQPRGDLAWKFATFGPSYTLEPMWHTVDRKGVVKFKKVTLKELRNNKQLCNNRADEAAVALLRPNADVAVPWQNQVEPMRAVSLALQQLIGHAHLYDAHTDAHLSAREAPPVLTLKPAKTGGHWRIDVGGKLHSPAETLALFRDGAEVLATRNADELQISVFSKQLRALLEAIGSQDHVAEAAFAATLVRLPQLAQLVAVNVPDTLRGKKLKPLSKLVVQIDALQGADMTLHPRVRPLEGGVLLRPGAGQTEMYGQQGGQRFWTERDFKAELGNLTKFWTSLGIKRAKDEDPADLLQLTGEDALDAVAKLSELPDIEVLWSKKRQVATADQKHLRVQILDKPDWFGVQGSVKVGGLEVDLAAVLEAVRQRKGYVQVSGDVWLRLTQSLRKNLEKAADAVTQTKQGLGLSPLQAQALEGIAELEGAAKKWLEALAKIKAATKLQPELPKGLNAELRHYQLEGFHWLVRLAGWSTGALLADDMGLGKTVQALALLLHRQALGPALVVAPTSVEFNWLREAEKFAPSLKFAAWRHGDRKQSAQLGPSDVLVISYDLLVRDVEVLQKTKFSTLVLDEAQSVKNATTLRWKAIHKLQADFRLGLTGTPVENHIGELWAVLAAVVPGLLGPWQVFHDRYGVAIERDNNPEVRKGLARILKPFLLRRMKGEVAKELPARTEVRVDIEPSPEERELYQQVRLASLQELEDNQALLPQQRRFQILAAITRLRQVACHPKLFDPMSNLPSSKLEHLLERLTQLMEEGHKTLVFSQFVQHLNLVRQRLDEAKVNYRYLDGSTPEKKRREEVDKFQAGDGDVFLISLKAGGTGLNLTAASYVIHLDPWWNPAVEDQATDRAHRIGQDKPVTVYRLVSRGTIEESILELHARKRDLVASLLDGTGDATVWKVEELLEILGKG